MTRAIWGVLAAVVLAQATGGNLPRPGSAGEFARCLNGSADSACFEGARQTMIAGAAPAAPSGLTFTVSGSAVTLSWLAPAGAGAIATYLIEAGSTTGSANLASISTGNGSTTYAASGVGNGTYYVRVRAQNAAGTSAPSNEAVVVVGGTQSSAHAFDLLEVFVGMDWTLGSVSPDIAFAPGWNHLVLVRNSAIALFRKSTGADPTKPLSAVSLQTFFGRNTLTGDRLTDPFVVFDADAGRFFMIIAQMNAPMAMLMAVSKSPYPETLTDADWYFYRLARNEDASEADFDKLVVVGDKLLVSWQRTATSASGPVGVGTRIRVMDKRALMNGTAPGAGVDLTLSNALNLRARPASIALARDRDTLRDAAVYDIYRVCGSANRQVWTLGVVSGVATAPRLDTRDFVSPFPCSNTPVTAPQPGGGLQVRFPHIATNPVFHDGHLWVFEPAGGSDPGTTSGIQWMELDVRGWPDAISVVQSGTFSEPGIWHYVPAAAVDWAGNLVLTYVRSGPNDFASAYYTGRLATDPPGTLRSPRVLRSGGRRWTFDSNFLDFSTPAVDPADGSVWIPGLVPSPALPVLQSPENSDVWIGRVRPIDATPGASRSPR
jgi:hypothetical protein